MSEIDGATSDFSGGDRAGSPNAEVGSSRLHAMAAFLKAAGWGDVVPAPLVADASFRRYYRLRRGHDRAIVMDAPPPQEDVGSYLLVAATLRRLGLSAPEVLAEDRTQGFLLIEDFGDDTYTRLLGRGADATELYGLAIDTLAALQQRVAADGLSGLDPPNLPSPGIPPYDETRLLGEAALLADWYVPACTGVRLTIEQREEYLALWRAALAPVVESFPATLVLRDFHVDNLMLLPDRDGVRRCGLLDFQDAVRGPPGYDLVSLLEDARRDVAPALRRVMIERYLAAFPAFDRQTFTRAAAVLATQRNCKILGIFTRLWQRDGKPGYLAHMPRLWRLIGTDLHEPALGAIGRWLDRHVPPAARAGHVPRAGRACPVPPEAA